MGMMSEFKSFAMRGNVVDMAVGIIIGGAFGKIVSSFVADVIMPPIGMLLGAAPAVAPVLGALTVLVLFMAGRDLYGARAGFFAALFLGLFAALFFSFGFAADIICAGPFLDSLDDAALCFSVFFLTLAVFLSIDIRKESNTI